MRATIAASGISSSTWPSSRWVELSAFCPSPSITGVWFKTSIKCSKNKTESTKCWENAYQITKKIKPELINFVSQRVTRSNSTIWQHNSNKKRILHHVLTISASNGLSIIQKLKPRRNQYNHRLCFKLVKYNIYYNKTETKQKWELHEMHPALASHHAAEIYLSLLCPFQPWPILHWK